METASIKEGLPSRPLAKESILGIVIIEATLAGVAVAVGWLVGFDPFRTLQMDETSLAVILGCAAALPMLAMVWACTKLRWQPIHDLVRLVDERVAPLFVGQSWIALAAISVAAGFGEEVLFRGLIQDGIGFWTDSSVFGLLIGCIVFGAVHPLSRAYMGIAAMMGGFLGLLFLLTDDLLVPIVTHAVYDFIALLWLVRRREYALRDESAAAKD